MVDFGQADPRRARASWSAGAASRSDITEARLSGNDAVRAARTDPLTGLANRLLVRELLEEAVLRQWEDQSGCALLLVDLDRFKLVNDTLGHAIGDQLLVEVGAAARSLRSARAAGSAGIGGDEFAIVWQRRQPTGERCPPSPTRSSPTCRKASPSAPPRCTSARRSASPSAPPTARCEEQLMRSADLALYRAKEAGRGGHAFFERYMFDEAEDHRLLEQDVREALERRRADAGLSADHRCRQRRRGRRAKRCFAGAIPKRGDIPPDQFIPIIEDAGLIHQIGDWVIREACAEAARWDSRHAGRGQYLRGATDRRRPCPDGARRACRDAAWSRAGSSWK